MATEPVAYAAVSQALIHMGYGDRFQEAKMAAYEAKLMFGSRRYAQCYARAMESLGYSIGREHPDFIRLQEFGP